MQPSSAVASSCAGVWQRRSSRGLGKNMLSIHMAYWIQCIYNLDTIFTGDVADSGPDTELPATLCPATRNVSFNYDACLFECPLQSLLIQVGFFCAREAVYYRTASETDYHLIFGAPALKKGVFQPLLAYPVTCGFGALFLVCYSLFQSGSLPRVVLVK